MTGREALADARDALRQHVLGAYELGHEIALDHCIYGPTADAMRGYLGETMSYYRLLAGHCVTTKAQRILEVGTHYGGSSLAMAAGMDHAGTDDGTILTMDVTDLNREEIDRSRRIHKIIGDSTELGCLLGVAAEFDREDIDLLYIDALKTPDFVLHTMHNVYEAGLRPRWMILDDIQSNAEMKRLWEVLEAEAGDTAFLISREFPEIRRPDMGYGIFDLRDGADLLAKSAELMRRLELASDHFERRTGAGRSAGVQTALQDQDFRKSFPDAPADTCGPAIQDALYAMARDVFTGDGDIVDVGVMRGASTFALARGLGANPSVSQKRARIHAFDTFRIDVAADAKYHGDTFEVGDSTLQQFQETLGEFQPLTNAYPMALNRVRWYGAPIEILVASNLRSPYANSHLYSEFLPYLLPEKSIFAGLEVFSPQRVFATYAFASVAHRFRIVGLRGTAVFAAYVSPVSRDELLRITENRFAPEERVDLVEGLAERVGPEMHFDVLIQAGWVAIKNTLLGRAETVAGRLDELSPGLDKARTARLTRLKQSIEKNR